MIFLKALLVVFDIIYKYFSIVGGSKYIIYKYFSIVGDSKKGQAFRLGVGDQDSSVRLTVDNPCPRRRVYPV